ncbi:SDR family oxidoreductase [Zavarzinia compransoris]|uniref:SDR family NAD(P)-dependent oxidoreductase n=1 Tax=Zavarzinia marina TaxID=2911065 RepID=UPI001F38C4B9|nr:SDR family oxidoreductase [Zavarzinia marina]MCF4166500.1 SDR family oxidoreductase [Zavarzinia marina]
MAARRVGEGCTALVTGASAGLGAAFARSLAKRGFGLILTARRAERLEALAGEIRRDFGSAVTVLPADLADPEAPAILVAAIEAQGLSVDMLVNNAGYGIPEIFERTDWAAQRDLIQVMVTSVAELCHRLLPAMLARKRGWIVNVASLAVFAPPVPGSTLYAGVKAFDVRFSEFLAAEVAGRGVHVLATCPGFTRTEFHQAAGMTQATDTIPGWQWQQADVVAEEAVAAVLAGRGPVLVNGTVNRAGALLLKYLPGFVIRALAERHPLAKRARFDAVEK